MDPFIKKFLDRHRELESIVNEFMAIQGEWNDSQITLASLRRRFPEEFPEPEEAQSPGMATPEGGKLTIRGYAKYALKNGPLHATDILKGLRESGWEGSGDDRKDLRNIAATLTHSDRFENIGENRWAIKETKKEVAQ